MRRVGGVRGIGRHGIDFADAALVLEDDFAITIEDADHEERRFVTLGTDPYARILVVVYTWRAGTQRLISARKANKKERRASTVRERKERHETMKDEYDFSQGRRRAVVPSPPKKSRITIRLDEDILSWFKEAVHRAGGGTTRP